MLELADYLATTEYAVVALDPAYKLHRSDSNEERGAVDLMRRLDAWRDAYQFGLILPMHTRKPPAGLQLRLTIHELFGSSAYTRGAEVVLGLELIRPGYSRMHVLKHRRGELTTGERWGLVYDRETGYRRDPRETSDEPQRRRTRPARPLRDAGPHPRRARHDHRRLQERGREGARRARRDPDRRPLRHQDLAPPRGRPADPRGRRMRCHKLRVSEG